MKLMFIGKTIKRCVFFAFIFFSGANYSADETCRPLKSKIYYMIAPEDRLSDISLTFGFRPLWGKRNFVKILSRINNISDEDLIYPGQLIELPFRCEQDLKNYVLIQKGQKRIIDPNVLIKVKAVLVGKNQYEMVLRYPDGSSQIWIDPLDRPSPKDQFQRSTANFSSKKPKKKSSLTFYDNFLNAKTYGKVRVFSGIRSIESHDSVTSEDLVLVSSPTYGFSLEFLQEWSDKWRTTLFYDLENVKFKETSNAVIKNKEQALASLGVRSLFEFSRWGSLGLDFQFQHYLFVQGETTSIIRIDKVLRPSAKIQWNQKVLRGEKTELSFDINYHYLFSSQTSSVNLSESSGLSAGPVFRKFLSNKQLEFKLIYQKNNQKTSRYEQIDKGIATGVSVNMLIP